MTLPEYLITRKQKTTYESQLSYVAIGVFADAAAIAAYPHWQVHNLAT